MLFIIGARWNVRPFGQVELECPVCAKAVMHTAQRLVGRFTLFFVPVVPLSSQYQVVCNICGNKRKAAGELKTQLEVLNRTGKLPALV